MNNDSLTQIQIEFEERLARLAAHHRQALLDGLIAPLPPASVARQPLFKQCQLFLLHLCTSVYQHRFWPQRQVLYPPQDGAVTIPGEEAIIIIDAAYHVVEADASLVSTSSARG
jgi:hypothetical protein